MDKLKTKLMLKTDDKLWSEVTSYKALNYNKFKDINDAVIDLIKKGLKHEKNRKQQ